jgi:hypothetical protein
MQAGNPFAQRSKIDPHLGTHPSMGAVAAKFRGRMTRRCRPVLVSPIRIFSSPTSWAPVRWVAPMSTRTAPSWPGV